MTRIDDSLRNDVQFELKYDPKITSSDIGVAVKEGVVTLFGFVPSYWEKDAAEKAAKRVFGVKAVANDIEVKPDSKRTDPEIARDVVHELQNSCSSPKRKRRRASTWEMTTHLARLSPFFPLCAWKIFMWVMRNDSAFSSCGRMQGMAEKNLRSFSRLIAKGQCQRRWNRFLSMRRRRVFVLAF
jgi:BON domain